MRHQCVDGRHQKVVIYWKAVFGGGIQHVPREGLKSKSQSMLMTTIFIDSYQTEISRHDVH